MTTQLPPPGWYPDPSDPRRQAYWDGSQWSSYVGPQAVHAGASGRIMADKRFVLILGALAAVLVLIVAVLAVSWVVTDKPWKSDAWRHCVAEGPMIEGQSQSELESACDKVAQMSNGG